MQKNLIKFVEVSELPSEIANFKVNKTTKETKIMLIIT